MRGETTLGHITIVMLEALVLRVLRFQFNFTSKPINNVSMPGLGVPSLALEV
jgi:hypothetical protein